MILIKNIFPFFLYFFHKTYGKQDFFLDCDFFSSKAFKNLLWNFRVLYQNLKFSNYDLFWNGLEKINDTWWWSDGVQLNMSDHRFLIFKSSKDAIVYSFMVHQIILPDEPGEKCYPLCEKQVWWSQCDRFKNR